MNMIVYDTMFLHLTRVLSYYQRCFMLIKYLRRVKIGIYLLGISLSYLNNFLCLGQQRKVFLPCGPRILGLRSLLNCPLASSMLQRPVSDKYLVIF